MSIDLSTIKPGGKVSVTLDDGTKITDSPVTQGLGSRLWCASELVILSRDGHALSGRIVSIDAYTPPKPEWDRPEVYAVVDGYGTISTREGSEFRRGGATIAAAHLEEQYGPCSVLAVFAHHDSGGVICPCGFKVHWDNAADHADLQNAIENHEGYCTEGVSR